MAHIKYRPEQRTVGGLSPGTQLAGDFTAFATLKHTGRYHANTPLPVVQILTLDRAQIYDAETIAQRVTKTCLGLMRNGLSAPVIAIEDVPVARSVSVDLHQLPSCCKQHSWSATVGHMQAGEAPPTAVYSEFGSYQGFETGWISMLAYLDGAIRQKRLLIPQDLKLGPTPITEVQQLKTKVSVAGRAYVQAPDTTRGEFDDFLWATAAALLTGDQHYLNKEGVRWSEVVQNAVIETVGQPLRPPWHFMPYFFTLDSASGNAGHLMPTREGPFH